MRVQVAKPVVDPLTEGFSGYIDNAMKFVPVNESEGSFVGGVAVLPEHVEIAPPKCTVCEKESMIQVCQLFAPLLEYDRRSLHLFVCRECKKGAGSWRVFRSQTVIPLKEEEKDAEEEEEKEEVVEKEEKEQRQADSVELSAGNPFADLVAVRNITGTNKNNTKKKKKKKKKKQVQKKKVMEAWKGCAIQPHWLDVLINEKSSKKKSRMNEKDVEEEQQLLEKYGLNQDDFKSSSKKSEWKGEGYERSQESKTFRRFQKAMKEDSERIIHYEMGGNPYWISDPVPFEKAPRCRNCDAACLFEFQLFPTFLFLGESDGLWSSKTTPKELEIFQVKGEEDAVVVKEEECGEITEDTAKSSGMMENVLDRIQFESPLPEFGVVVVYSCGRSCESSDGVVEEYVYSQVPI